MGLKESANETKRRLLKKKSSLDIFRSLSTLRYLLFLQILRDGNIYLIDRRWYPDKKYQPTQDQEIKDTWAQLQDDYFEQRDNLQNKIYLRQNAEKLKQMMRITVLEELKKSIAFLDLIRFVIDEGDWIKKKFEVVEQIKKTSPRYRANQFSETFELLKDVEAMIKSATNVYNERVKNVENAVDKKEINGYKVLAHLSRVLGLTINMNKITVAEFIGYEEVAQEMQQKK